ncbi:MAG: hypothetical protein KUG51_03005 [Urechidicola sp.]|nr:hypothetical protein [Urechidicola sp.]
MGKYKITCDEATAICDKNQYGESKFTDRLKLMIHFFGCKICKCYTKQNGLMTKVYKSYSKDKCNKHPCLSPEDKVILEESVKEKIS